MKRILSIALAALLVITMIPMTVFADTSKATDIVDVTGKTEITLGGVTYTVVTSASEITDANGNYYLANDIELTATIINKFTGYFNGGGHTITLNGASTVFAGEIGRDGEALVCNFIIEKKTDSAVNIPSGGGVVAPGYIYGGRYYNITNRVDVVAGGYYVGGLFGGVGSDTVATINIESCKNEGDVTYNKSDENNHGYTGGILGGLTWRNTASSAEINLIDCVNTGKISGRLYVGGIVGGAYKSSNDIAYEKVSLQGCENSGTIEGVNYIGGIYGGNNSVIFKELSISDCINKGTIKGSYSAGIVGGFNTATINELSISDCINNGTITGGNYVAGVVGGFNTATIKRFAFVSCENIGTVSGGVYVGGILGANVNSTIGDGDSSTVDALIEKCVNKASVSSADVLGGIMGGIGNGANVSATYTFKECINESTGTVTSTAKVVGGVIGGTYNSNAAATIVFDIKDCTNKANVTAKGASVGGILGGAYNQSAKHSITVNGCTNSGEISTTSEYGAGGILGYFGSPKADTSIVIDNCANTGNVSAKHAYIGGIFAGAHNPGAKAFNVTITNSVNEGNVFNLTHNASTYGLAGIMGHMASATNSTVKIESCVNKGNVTAIEQRAAGIVCLNASINKITVKSCENTGVITVNECSESHDKATNKCDDFDYASATLVNLSLNKNTIVEITECTNSGTAEKTAVITGKDAVNVYTVGGKLNVCVAHNHVTAGESNTIGACSVCEYQPDYMGFVQFNDTTKAARFVMVVNNNLDVDYETFNMTVTINGKSITYASEDLDAFATVTADGVKYTAADGYLLFGAVVNMGEVAVESASVTITAGETVLYSGSI